MNIEKCPVCGSNDLKKNNDNMHGTVSIQCNNCFTRGPREDSWSCPKKWNDISKKYFKTPFSVNNGHSFCEVSDDRYSLGSINITVGANTSGNRIEFRTDDHEKIRDIRDRLTDFLQRHAEKFPDSTSSEDFECDGTEDPMDKLALSMTEAGMEVCIEQRHSSARTTINNESVDQLLRWMSKAHKG